MRRRRTSPRSSDRPARAGDDRRARRARSTSRAWNRAWPARALRRVSLPTWILPLARAFAWIQVEGLEHLKDLEGPVMFASNHQSHMDTPAILCGAAGEVALPRGGGDGEGVLQGTLLPGAVRAARVVHQQPELLPGGTLLQRLPAAAAGGRRAADAAVYRRPADRRLVSADFSRRDAARTTGRSRSSGRASG